MPQGNQAINDELDRQRRDWIKQNTIGILHVRVTAEGITSTRKIAIVAVYENERSLEAYNYELYDGMVLLNPRDSLWDYPTIEDAKFYLRDTYGWRKTNND